MRDEPLYNLNHPHHAGYLFDGRMIHKSISYKGEVRMHASFVFITKGLGCYHVHFAQMAHRTKCDGKHHLHCITVVPHKQKS